MYNSIENSYNLWQYNRDDFKTEILNLQQK